mgnify:CR=1 FL=1
MDYDSQEYAASRLNGTVVLCSGKPVKVLAVEDDMSVLVETLHKKEIKTLPLSSLSFEDIKLGYVNYQSGAMFVVRRPVRKPRQGLSNENLYNSILGSTNVPVHTLHSTIINSFPTISSAIKKVLGGASRCAFSRDFCIKEGMVVEYKGCYDIGEVNDELCLTLKTNFNYLKERLNDFTTQGLSTRS